MQDVPPNAFTPDPPPKPNALGPFGQRVLGATLVVLACAGVAWQTSHDAHGATEPTTETPSSAVRFAEARAHHATRLLAPGPSPQPYDAEVPSEAKAVRYPSHGASLLAWLAQPPSDSDAPRPLVVYAHGGFALGTGDFDDARPFYDAGMIVFLPALRGENGNPGNYELGYGEVDDLVAAIRYAAALPGVDRRRVYVIGHSAGGMVSGLAALTSDLPVTLTASVGGVYSPAVISTFGEMAPFDTRDASECRLRSLVPFAAELAHEHVAYVGTDDAAIRNGIAEVRRAAARSNGKLVLVDVPGDHFGSLAPAITDFLGRISSGAPTR